MNLDKDVIIEIDKILDDGFNDKTIMVNRNNKNNHKAINICKGLDFITEKDGVTFRLKEKAASIYNLPQDELIISWQSDKVVYDLISENHALEILKVAESKVEYLKTKKK